MLPVALAELPVALAGPWEAAAAAGLVPAVPLAVVVVVVDLIAVYPLVGYMSTSHCMS